MNRRTAFSLALLNAFAPAGAFGLEPLAPAFPVSEPTTTESLNPGVAAAPDGSFVVAWQYRTPSSAEPDSENRDIHARRFGPRGQALGEEFVVNSTLAGQQEEPRVAMNSDGDFAVVWRSRLDGYSNYGVYARRFRADGVPKGAQFRVNQRTDEHQQLARVALDAAGHMVVTWQKFHPFPRSLDVLARCYGPSGEPVTDEFLVHHPSEGTQHAPAVAMTADGHFVIAFGDWSNDAYDVRAQRFDATCQPVGNEILVAHAGPGETFYKNEPAVAIDADGDFVVAWRSDYQDGDSSGVYARRYRADGVARGGEFRVNAVTTGEQGRPEVSMDAAGNFAVAWVDRQGPFPGNLDVHARGYKASGERVGLPLRVHPASTLVQRSPDIALDADGDFVIAWMNGKGNSNYDIQARRFQGSAQVDLLLNQFDSPDPVQAGQPVSYTLKVHNLNAPSTPTAFDAINRAIDVATNIRVVSTPPAGATNVSASGDHWKCGVADDRVDCRYLAVLRAGRSASPLQIQLTAPGSADISIGNAAKVTAEQLDPKPANNRDTESTLLQN